MLRTTQCLDSGLTYGGKIVSLENRPRSTLQKHLFSASDTNFCQRLSNPQGLMRVQSARSVSLYMTECLQSADLVLNTPRIE
jgi:hypothetical protein